MSYEQLSLGSFIKEMKEVTDGAHPRKFCFILGAGASRSSGIKSGQELVRIWDKDLRERNEEEYHRWRKELAITDENMSSFYSQYYEKRFRRCPADGYNYIEKIMESAKPSAGYVVLSYMLTKTPHNVVITTNFDHLTEDAVNYYAQSTPLVIGHEALAHYVSGQPVRPTIIKIHRDLLFDPKSRTEDLEKLPNSWKTALELIFENYHPVFIGYAGNDKSLMDFLVENGDKFVGNEWKYPYWMLYKTDEIEGKVREFLEKSDGFFIRHSGFDEAMIQLGAEFGYTMPTEKVFLEDARKRYRALADAIDALSDASMTTNITDVVTDSTIIREISKHTTDSNGDKREVNQAIEKITSQTEMQRMYRDATKFIDDEQYDQAKLILEQLVSMESTNSRYQNSLGDVYFYMRRPEDALNAYQKAMTLDPKVGIYHINAAFALRAMGRIDDAIKEHYEAIEVEPEEDIYCLFLANLLIKEGRDEEALSVYRRAMEIDPDDADYPFYVAQMHVKMKQYNEALEPLQKAISLDQENAEYYDTLALIFENLGREKDAKKAIQTAEELRNKVEAAVL